MINISILVLSALGYGFYNYNNISDTWTLWMMSFFFALGVFSLLKSFQYLFFSEKTMAKIVTRDSSDVNTGKVQDIGSYSRGYRYSFLIDGEKYTMPSNSYFGSKYKIGDTVKVSIINQKKRTATPMRAIYNIVFIGVVALYMSIKMMGR